MKKQKGMTIVETIVAFSILLIAIALFYGSINLSSKFIARQNYRRDQFEKMVDTYYKKDENIETINSDFSISDNGSFSANDFNNIKVKKITNDEGGVIYYYEYEE